MQIVPFQGRSAGRRKYRRTFSLWRLVVEVGVVGDASSEFKVPGRFWPISHAQVVRIGLLCDRLAHGPLGPALAAARGSGTAIRGGASEIRIAILERTELKTTKSMVDLRDGKHMVILTGPYFSLSVLVSHLESHILGPVGRIDHAFVTKSNPNPLSGLGSLVFGPFILSQLHRPRTSLEYGPDSGCRSRCHCLSRPRRVQEAAGQKKACCAGQWPTGMGAAGRHCSQRCLASCATSVPGRSKLTQTTRPGPDSLKCVALAWVKVSTLVEGLCHQQQHSCDLQAHLTAPV